MGPLIRDSDWVRQSFLVENSALEAVDLQNRIFTSASLKFTDTTPGGNFAINPVPQFTRTADIKVQGRFSAGKGMGRYYSEAIDDNAQIIHMRFGVPQFNSLSTYFSDFYNSSAGQLARTGRATNAFYLIGRAAGFIVSLISWKLLAVHLLGVGLRFALQKPASKYYYLKPTMALYWNAVNTMTNQISVNRGIVPRVGGPPDDSKYNTQYEFDAAAMQTLNSMLPDVFKFGGGVDVGALAGRAQRLARKHYKKMEAVMNSAVNMKLQSKMDDLSKQVQSIAAEPLTDKGAAPHTGATGSTVPGYLEQWLASTNSQPKAAKEGSDDAVSTTESVDDTEPPGFFDFLSNELDDGRAFASFRVNSTGSMSESFSSSVRESDILSKINNMSSQSRSTNFSLAGGNLTGGVVGTVLGGIANAVKDVANGVMDSLSVSGLAALGGAAFADIPKHWNDSTANLPRANYTVSLVSPYGNPISQLINLHIPMAMLLAGALPLSTGKQSYTSPFLVELYDKGRCQTRLGMIDSLSITRGTGNLGYNNEGHAMAIDVSFSVIDMSSIMSMPITQGFTIGKVATVVATTTAAAVIGGPAAAAVAGVGTAAVQSGVFDDDNVFTDYLAVISGMGLADQIYTSRKLKLNLTRAMANWDSFTSASHFAGFVGEILPVSMFSALFKGTAR